ncbi:MAG: hypothetical protein KIT11_05065 [Fimbriimonadaceae bacterium]|nr:hypothetical protein [Fimbriimonadaceae bacterium]QYK56736.1 MAG: hypothetical protein KF733_04455 [Fimbriimonadaceae bacterium]
MKFVRGCGLVGLAMAAVAMPVVEDLSLPGPYQPGFRQVTVRRPNNSTFTAFVYYPATANGTNAPLDRSAAPYPAVTFGHGFLQTLDRYRSTLDHLATRGYIVIATTTEGGLFPNHANFAADMRHCLTHLETENGQAGAFFEDAVATDRFGASGHSMGGGASILAASADPRIKALANLAAAETNPSAIAAMASVTAPASLIAGSEDGIVPPSTNGQRMYENGGPPRQLPVVTGGWHCGFQDVSSFGCDTGSLTRPLQLAETRRLLTAFFDLNLKRDQTRWRLVWGPEMVGNPQTTTTFDPGARATPPELTREVPRNQRATFDVTVHEYGPGPAKLCARRRGQPLADLLDDAEHPGSRRRREPGRPCGRRGPLAQPEPDDGHGRLQCPLERRRRDADLLDPDDAHPALVSDARRRLAEMRGFLARHSRALTPGCHTLGKSAETFRRRIPL